MLLAYGKANSSNLFGTKRKDAWKGRLTPVDFSSGAWGRVRIRVFWGQSSGAPGPKIGTHLRIRLKLGTLYHKPGWAGGVVVCCVCGIIVVCTYIYI